MFVSKISKNEPIIDEDNFHLYAPPSDVVINGEHFSRGLNIPKEKPFRNFTAPYDHPVIPRGEWADRIKDREKVGNVTSRIVRDAGIPTSNQNSTNFCWTYGVITGVNCNRCRRNLPYVEFSRESVAAPIKNYRNNGGWGQEAIEYMAEFGIMPQDLWPRYHYNSSKYRTTENLAKAAQYKIELFRILQDRNFAQLMTALLEDEAVAVGYNWWRHEVCAVDPVVIGMNAFGVRIWNSWGDSYGDKGFAILSESKATPDDAVFPVIQHVN